jgi:hypothetical protein
LPEVRFSFTCLERIGLELEEVKKVVLEVHLSNGLKISEEGLGKLGESTCAKSGVFSSVLLRLGFKSIKSV